jgi:hypothetical protein
LMEVLIFMGLPLRGWSCGSVAGCSASSGIKG